MAEKRSVLRLVSELAPGLSVARDVDVRGTVLLKAGTVLTDPLIDRLEKWHVTSINVHDTAGLSPEGASNGSHDAELADNEGYLRERERLDTLFTTTGDDRQMAVLKRSLMHYIEELYLDQQK